jgi:hypothetical protein
MGGADETRSGFDFIGGQGIERSQGGGRNGAGMDHETFLNPVGQAGMRVRRTPSIKARDLNLFGQ